MNFKVLFCFIFVTLLLIGGNNVEGKPGFRKFLKKVVRIFVNFNVLVLLNIWVVLSLHIPRS